MLSKGQGRTMGSYYMLLNALAGDERLDEAEELWTKLFSENLDSMPRIFFEKMLSIYYCREMHEKMFEIFADMKELGIKPTRSVKMIGDGFQKLGMMDKYQKLNKKYTPPKWVCQYVKEKRIKVKATDLYDSSDRKLLKEPNEIVNKNSIKATESTQIERDIKVDHYQNQAIDSAESVETIDAREC